jgi:IclR family acetate operon transcriptional repressor
MGNPGHREAATRNLVQSVGRAASLLHCFARGPRERTLTELAKETGLTPSTAHRILRTLTASGLLTHDPDVERYLPGPSLLELATSLLARDNLAGATEIIEALAVRTGETASIGIRDRKDIVILRHAESPEPLRFERPTSTRVPLHVSAMGKALLSFGSDPVEVAVEALLPLEPMTHHSLITSEELGYDLKVSKERGYTIVDEEQYLGVRSIGAPVLWSDGVARAAISIAGPKARLTDDRLPDVARAVTAAANAIRLQPFVGEEL